jgi:hypothetical protein
MLYFDVGFLLPSFILGHEGRDVSDILGFYGLEASKRSGGLLQLNMFFILPTIRHNMNETKMI